MPKLQTYAQDGRLLSEVDTRTVLEARADKLQALAAALTSRITAVIDPGEDDLVLVMARVQALSDQDRAALLALRQAARDHREAIRGLKTVGQIDAYDLEKDWPA